MGESVMNTERTLGGGSSPPASPFRVAIGQALPATPPAFSMLSLSAPRHGWPHRPRRINDRPFTEEIAITTKLRWNIPGLQWL